MNSVRFNLKRALVSFLCLVTVLSSAFIVGNVDSDTEAEAASISDYQQFIKDLEAEQKEIQAELNKLKGDMSNKKALQTALQKNIDNLQSQINACNRQISDLDATIVELEEDIAKKTEELEATKYTFRQRLRAIYMSGGAQSSAMSILMSAENLEDLLTKTELTKSISAYDSALMNKIVNDMKAIEANKEEINRLLAEQETTKATLREKKSQYDKQIKEVKDIISDIDGEMDDLKDQADKIEDAIDEYEQAIKDAQNVGADQKYDGVFSWPCPGYYTITSPYGYRTHPISGKYKFHKGIDIAGSGIKGKPIVAAADGIVSIATYNTGGYGYYVMVNHGTGSDGKKYVSLYAHMTKYIVKVGQSVKKGQTIGYVGTSGASTGYHLHFEIRVNGDTTNPMSYYK